MLIIKYGKIAFKANQITGTVQFGTRLRGPQKCIKFSTVYRIHLNVEVDNFKK